MRECGGRPGSRALTCVLRNIICAIILNTSEIKMRHNLKCKRYYKRKIAHVNLHTRQQESHSAHSTVCCYETDLSTCVLQDVVYISVSVYNLKCPSGGKCGRRVNIKARGPWGPYYIVLWRLNWSKCNWTQENVWEH